MNWNKRGPELALFKISFYTKNIYCRDHSDGIWNESQATVLQVDSGTDNGTALSSSEVTSATSPGSVTLLTPSSRRKHLLLLQHQQRSSMDTEILDEEFVDQVQRKLTLALRFRRKPHWSGFFAVLYIAVKLFPTVFLLQASLFFKMTSNNYKYTFMVLSYFFSKIFLSFFLQSIKRSVFYYKAPILFYNVLQYSFSF